MSGIPDLVRSWSRLGFAFLATVILGCSLFAQVSTTGKIDGVVTHASGAAVAAASVMVRGPALMADRTSPAQADGSYLFDLLPPGTYELITTAQGFQALRQTSIVISAGFTATINSHLQVGQLQQTVTVAGEPVVDVLSVQAQTTFDNQLLQDIPAGRDPWSTVGANAGGNAHHV